MNCILQPWQIFFIVLGVLANGLLAQAADVLCNNPPAVSASFEPTSDLSGNDPTSVADSFALDETLQGCWGRPDPNAPTWALPDDITIDPSTAGAVAPSLNALHEETSFTAIQFGSNCSDNFVAGSDWFRSSNVNSSFTAAPPHDISSQLSGTVVAGTSITLLLLVVAGIALCSFFRRRRQQTAGPTQSPTNSRRCSYSRRGAAATHVELTPDATEVIRVPSAASVVSDQVPTEPSGGTTSIT
jgi:hypothetical protein